jgi:hypothetical protein
MKRVVPLIILAMFLAGAGLQAIRMIWNVGEKTELDYEEGNVLYQASQIFQFRRVFGPLQHYPHVALNYAPLYLVAVRVVTRAIGDPVLSGRLISMAATVWLVGLFGWTVFQATRGYAPTRVRWFGALFAGAWMLQVPSMVWVPYARVDMLGLALQFTGLSIIAVRPFRLRNQILAFCLLLLGLYTKQSLVSIPVASVLLIALIRPVRALWLASGLLAAGLGILAFLAWITDGGVIRHWLLYNVNPFHLKDIVFGEFHFSMEMAPLIATGLTGFWLTFPGSESWRRSWRKAVSARLAGSALRRTGVAFGFVALFGFVVSWGVGKEGASINYCLDWQLALCLLAGVFLVLFARNWTRRDQGMAFLRPLLALLLGAIALQLGVGDLWDANEAIGLIGSARERRAAQRLEEANLVKLISSFRGPVESDNMVALLRAGKPLPFEPSIIKATTEAGIFDENPLVKRTSEGFFDAFILRANLVDKLYTPRLLEAIRKNYKLYPFGGSTYLVYVRSRP